ncbi:hypothetical protein H6F39_04655 [Anabaena sp. FACHB-1250]|uniref:Uncharacterized protein n=1 Tax=Dolichospermum flos-aquae LEGE 04289 TaxID=1828708 RepID=A0ACC5Q1L6_DOLFA|nr:MULTISPECIES: hypothetical protein [Nostocales]MBD2140687.1 hypothetical protein [Anabaena sp. FACHB-1250]MBD2268755.1 hypothetical protein [Anabaena sp. FACHB-1391]MBE9218940.1 hypothetical protein [Dolichospermum flos-aquae LEGE 04289]
MSILPELTIKSFLGSTLSLSAHKDERQEETLKHRVSYTLDARGQVEANSLE